MEEFDIAWGEVEKGLRDSFKAGRENKRGQRREKTASDASNQMAMIRQRQNTVSTPPTQQKRTVSRRRPAPPSGGSQRQTVSAPPKSDWSRPAGSDAPDMGKLPALNEKPGQKQGEMAAQDLREGDWNSLSRGRNPPQTKLEPIEAATVPEKTQEQNLGWRSSGVENDPSKHRPSLEQLTAELASRDGAKDWGDVTDAGNAVMANNRLAAENKDIPLNDARRMMSGGEEATPVPQAGSAFPQPMQQPPADPIDTATKNVEHEIDLSDGVDDPSNDAFNEAWDQEIAPPAPEPAPPAPPAPPEPVGPIATPASKVDAIKQPVEEALSEPEQPTSVADKPVKVEPEEQPTSVAGTPVEPLNPSAGLPTAPTPPKESTAADIAPSKPVSRAASENIAREGVSYGDYSKHLEGASRGDEASLKFLRENPDAVERFSPNGLTDTIRTNMGDEAPAKKAPTKAKAKPKPKSKPKKTDLDEATDNFIDKIVPKKTTAKTVASGEQPNHPIKNPKKKSESVNTDAKYGTFRGKQPGLKKSLSLSDLGFLRPIGGDVNFLTDREGRPSIAQAINPSHISSAYARPEKLSLDDLLAVKDKPLSFNNYRLMNNKGMPIMSNPPGPTGNDRFLHSNTGLSRMKANAAKHPLNSWNVDGKAYKDDGDFKALLAATGLKSRNRNPFGTPKSPKPQFGRPILYNDPTPTLDLPKGGLKLGYEMNTNGNKGLHQIHVGEPKMANEERTPMLAMPATFGDLGENFGVKNLEMSIKELASRIKSATGKDSPGGQTGLASVNDTGMDKQLLRELMQSLLSQPDQDETATISAGNTNKDGMEYSVPLGVQIHGSDALDGESERNLLTYLQAPYGIKETGEHFSQLPNLPPNMLE